MDLFRLSASRAHQIIICMGHLAYHHAQTIPPIKTQQITYAHHVLPLAELALQQTAQSVRLVLLDSSLKYYAL